MLYNNCHYKYKDRICEFIGFLSIADGSDDKVKIRYSNGKEAICTASELNEIPLTELILRFCYKSRTYVRDGNWDIIWYLGDTNNVIIGEKSGQYYLLSTDKSEKTVIDILPWEIIKTDKVIEPSVPQKLFSISELEKYISEVINIVNSKKDWI